MGEGFRERMLDLGWSRKNRFTEDPESLVEKFRSFEMTMLAFMKGPREKLLLLLNYLEDLAVYQGAVQRIAQAGLGPHYRVVLTKAGVESSGGGRAVSEMQDEDAQDHRRAREARIRRAIGAEVRGLPRGP